MEGSSKMSEGLVLWIFMLFFLSFIITSVYFAFMMQKAMKQYSDEIARQGRIAVENMGRVALAKDIYDLRIPVEDKNPGIVDNVTTNTVVSSESLSEEEFSAMIKSQLAGEEEEIDG